MVTFDLGVVDRKALIMRLVYLSRALYVCLVMAFTMAGCKASTETPAFSPGPVTAVPSETLALSATPSAVEATAVRPTEYPIPILDTASPIEAGSPTSTEAVFPTPTQIPSYTPTEGPTAYPAPYNPATGGYPGPGTQAAQQQPTSPPPPTSGNPYPGIPTPSAPPTLAPPTLAPQSQPGSTPAAASQTPQLTPSVLPPTITPTTFVLRTQLHASDPAKVQLSSGSPLLVEFFAYWSITCRSMAPVVHSLEGKYKDRIRFVYLDIDDPANADF